MKSLLIAATTIATAFAEPVPMTFTANGSTEVIYRFAAPEKTEEGKQYPLVLFFHGAGERGTDNKAQLKHGVNDILKGAADLGESVYLIAPQCPPERWWAEATPDRIFHGAADDVVPPRASEIMADTLKEIGGKAELTLYPGVGHNSWTQTYKDPEIIKWLFAQRKTD